MPELPEVQTVATGLKQMFGEQTIEKVVCHNSKLRYPVDIKKLKKICQKKYIKQIIRRGKYMIWQLSSRGAVIVHLGMSGRFCRVPIDTPLDKHDHLSFVLGNFAIRYRDPRRFGMVIAIDDGEWEKHALIASLGMEPLEQLDIKKLRKLAQKRKVSIKQFIMNQHIIVGVGNIYASESLFKAGIHPKTPVAKLSVKRWHKLTDAIEETLKNAIEVGGTTLRDGGFSDAEGNHGLFALELQVYDRKGELCHVCETAISQTKMAGRSTYFCRRCQR